MKRAMLVLTALTAALMLILPVFAITPGKKNRGSSSGGAASEAPTVKSDYFRILDTTTDEITNIPEWDYIWGVVAAEMGYTYQTEALKAQTVAAYTLAVRARSHAAANKEKYDLTNDYTKHQAYKSKEQAKSEWGDKYEENAAKISEAVESVKGLVLTYNKSPIFAAYHAISGGKTESAANIWGGEYKYLQPVESVGDLVADGYLTTVNYAPEAFAERAKALEISLKADDAEKFISEPKRSDSGTVLTYKLGGKEFKGTEMRAAFGLRSANFDLAYKDGELVFTVRGYGHGVGMSQKGADYMAQQGSTYNEILNWYYKDCEILEIGKVAEGK